MIRDIVLWDRYLKLVFVMISHLGLENELCKILNEVLIVLTLVN